MNALIPRASIMEIEANRNRALELYGEAFDALDRAIKVGGAASVSARIAVPHFAFETYHPTTYQPSRGDDRDAFLTRCRQDLDRGIWNHLLHATNLERLMDKTAREQFRDQLAKDPPPATADNCLATMEQLIGDADTIFKRGIATAFSKLDRRFRSHDGFKIGSRVVLSRAFGDYGSWNYYAGHDETLRDIERTFLTLDGKPHPERMAGFVGVVDAAKRDSYVPGSMSLQAFDAEDDYFRLRVFKNGNAHLWFKRTDLVEKVNLLLADYYGATLGAGADVADVKFAPKTGLAKNMGFFETPPAVRDRVYEAALIYRDTKAFLSILEPSAGLGALAQTAAEWGHHVSCIEGHRPRAEALAATKLYREVRWADFLEATTWREGGFDVVIMNPPFDGGRDIDHVTHAINFLRSGGRLVAVMSAGTEFREDRKTVAFRDLIQRYGGRFEDLPAGSFAASGTNVNTIICSLNAPGGR